MPTAGAAMAMSRPRATSRSWPAKSERSRSLAASVRTWTGPTARARPPCRRTPRKAARSARATALASSGKPARVRVWPAGCSDRRRRPCSAGE
eukprot:13101041-Alexandrium_andersonii.AAC.1